MSKHDLRARPVYRKRDSIEAHLTIVFAALAVTRFIEHRTGWSIKKFARTARRYRTIQIRAGRHTLTAEDQLPPDLHDVLARSVISSGLPTIDHPDSPAYVGWYLIPTEGTDMTKTVLITGCSSGGADAYEA
jgi:hypothetical protein